MTFKWLDMLPVYAQMSIAQLFYCLVRILLSADLPPLLVLVKKYFYQSILLSLNHPRKATFMRSHPFYLIVGDHTPCRIHVVQI